MPSGIIVAITVAGVVACLVLLFATLVAFVYLVSELMAERGKMSAVRASAGALAICLACWFFLAAGAAINQRRHDVSQPPPPEPKDQSND